VVRVTELETENAALRERVAQLDERTNTLSKEIVRAKFRGQQQVVSPRDARYSEMPDDNIPSQEIPLYRYTAVFRDVISDHIKTLCAIIQRLFG